MNVLSEENKQKSWPNWCVIHKDPPKPTVFNTAGFMKTVPSVCTLLLNTIYLPVHGQVAEGTVCRKLDVHNVSFNLSFIQEAIFMERDES